MRPIREACESWPLECFEPQTNRDFACYVDSDEDPEDGQRLLIHECYDGHVDDLFSKDDLSE